ncbi:OadG family protein [bacterium]|nr:OadG family protein [bacterium]
MLDASLWATGLTSMVVGMGIVFSFLVILIFAIQIMTKCVAIVDKFCPQQQDEPKTVKKQGSDESEIAVAIAVAMAQG